MKYPITLGADPENPLFDTESGRIVSALKVLKRKKDDPIKLGDGIAYYADNVLAEASFPPATTVAEMMVRLKTVWTRMHESLGSRYHLMPKTSHHYDADQLDEREVWEAGCTESFNGYTATVNPKPIFTDSSRTGSFHIHLGHKMLEGDTPMATRAQMVKLMDIFVGCAGVIFDKDETSKERRKLYGRAGEFRKTDYGIEYRVLGNYALRSPKLTELVWDLACYAVTQFENGYAKPIIEAVGSNRPQLAINDCDKQMAMQVLDVAGMPYKLMQRINGEVPSVPFKQAWGI